MANSKADIYVAFGADTAGLVAAIAVMNAQVKATTTTVNALGKEMEKAGASASAEIGTKLIGASQKLVSSREQLASYTAQLKSLDSGAATAAHGVEALSQAHGLNTSQLAESVHVFKALADEIAAGQNPLRAFAMEGGRIFQILSNGIPPAIAGWAGLGAVVLAAAGTIAYFAYQAIAAANAVKGIRFDAATEGFVATAAGAGELLKAVEKLGNVGAADAQAFIKPFLALGPVGESISAVASQYLPVFIANGKSAQEAGEQLAKSFADIAKGGRDVIAGSRLLTEEEKRTALAYVDSGDKVNAYRYALEILSRSMGGLSEEQKKAETETKLNQAAMVTAIASLDNFDSAERVVAASTAYATQKTRENEEELARWILKAQMATDQAGRLAAAMTNALKVDQTTSSIKAAEGQVREFQDALANTKDPESVAQLNRSLEITQDRLKRLRDEAVGGVLGGTSLDRIVKQNAAIDQQNQGSRSSQLKQELPGLQAAAADPTLDAKQRQAAEEKAAAMVLQIRDAEFEESKAKDDLRVTEAGKNSAQIIAIRQKEVAEAIRLYGEGNAKTIAAEQALAQARQAAATAGGAASNKAAREALARDQESLAQQIQSAETTAREKIKLYGLETQAKQLTEADKLRLTLAALAEEKAAVDKAYASEIALAGNTAAKIEQLRGRQKTFDLENAFAVAAAQEQAAIKTTQAWDKAEKSINSAVDGQIGGLLRGTTSWAQALKNVLATLTEDVVKFFVNWGLEATANAIKQIALGNTVTTAHVAANAAKTASDTGSAAASGFAWAANALKAITADAAQAFGGVFAFLAPVMGPFAAGPAAAASGTVLAAGASVASADIGMWSVPNDMLTMVHHNELIMPAAESGAVRDMLSGAASGEGQSGGRGVTVAPQLHFHNSAVDSRGLESLFSNNGGALMRAVAGAVRDGAHLGVRGARFA